MNGKNLHNEELDRIGRKLLETTRLGNEEIERVLAAPQIFNAVKARIRVEQTKHDSKKLFGNRGSLSAWNNRKSFAAAGVLAVFVIGAFGLIFFNKDSRHNELSAHAPEYQTQPASTNEKQSPLIYRDSPETAATKISAIKPREVTAKLMDFKKEIITPRKFERKTNFIKKQKASGIEPEREFYALAYAGNSIQSGDDLRIVRAELSRSSLFALGVNLPIENESEKIKTDLLVDSDGVARAIRLVD